MGMMWLISLLFVVSCSNDERMIARVVEAEAAGEPFYGKYLVASVIVNRTNHPDFGDSVCEVLQRRNQFARPKGSYSKESLLAAKLAMLTPRKGLFWFFNPITATDRNFTSKLSGCITIGNHTFCSTCK